MIRFTKDGKVNLLEIRLRGVDTACGDLADALDIAVAALRQAQDFWRASGSLTADDVQSNVDEALRQIGADHAP